MTRGVCVAVCALAACFDPRIEPGRPCSVASQECPRGLRCVELTNTCELDEDGGIPVDSSLSTPACTRALSVTPEVSLETTELVKAPYASQDGDTVIVSFVQGGIPRVQISTVDADNQATRPIPVSTVTSDEPVLTGPASPRYIAWQEETAGSFQLWTAPLDDAAMPLAASQLTVSTTHENQRPSVAALDSGDLAIAWQQVDQVGNARPRLGVIDVATMTIRDEVELDPTSSLSPRFPRIAAQGERLAVVWSDQSETIASLMLSTADAAGLDVQPAIELSDTAGVKDAAIVAAGDHFGVAWEERRTGSQGIQLQTIALDGDPGPARLAIAQPGSGNPSLAWTGECYGLAWQDATNDIYFVRVTEDGQPIGDPIPIAVTPTVLSIDPSVTITDSGFAVVWAEGGQAIFVVRIDITV